MRLRDFQKALSDKGIGFCLLLDDDPNIFYFSGIQVERCVLAIPSKGEPMFIVSQLEAERVKKYSLVKNVLSFDTAAERDQLLVKSMNAENVGLNKEQVSLKDFELLRTLKNASFKDVSETLSLMRQIKTSVEIEYLEEACRIADSILQKCIGSFDFRTELEVKAFLESETISTGNRLAFDTIVASGKNSCMPHYHGNNRTVKGFCVIDFGIKHNGYCSDITRTIFIGNPSKNEKELYALVDNARKKSVAAVTDGAAAKDVDAVARNTLGRHRKQFIHSLGHHIGIEAHDPGFRLSNNSEGVLKENMAITIEPGIYFSGKFGIRIEDDVLVKKKGCKVLTSSSRELISV